MNTLKKTAVLVRQDKLNCNDCHINYVTANKVRFQHVNDLKFIYITVDCGCEKEQIITSYYKVEGIGKGKTTEEIQPEKERHLQTLCDLRARRTEKLKDLKKMIAVKESMLT